MNELDISVILSYDLSGFFRFSRQVHRLTHFPEKPTAEACETVRLPRAYWEEAALWATNIIHRKSEDVDCVPLAAVIEGHSDIGRSITAVCPYGSVTLIILHPLDA